MRVAQIQSYLIGVLKGWVTNKSTLDKFSEDNSGNLLFDGTAIGGEEAALSTQELNALILETVTELNSSDEESDEEEGGENNGGEEPGE